jgi:hypothetical protein
MTQAIAAAGGTALVASAGGRLVSAITHAGGRHFTLPLMTKDPLNIWLNAGWLARLIRAEGVGIVHSRSRPPGSLARASAANHVEAAATSVLEKSSPLKSSGRSRLFATA